VSLYVGFPFSVGCAQQAIFNAIPIELRRQTSHLPHSPPSSMHSFTPAQAILTDSLPFSYLPHPPSFLCLIGLGGNVFFTTKAFIDGAVSFEIRPFFLSDALW